MNCEQMTLLISAWLDGETTLQEEKQMLEHLEQCAQCRALLEQLQTLRASFSDLEELSPAPEGFADRVMEQIRAERAPKVIPLFRRPQIRALMGVAACAVLCVGLMRGGMDRKSAENAMAAPAAAPAEMPAAAVESYGLEPGAGMYDMEYSSKTAQEPGAPMESVSGTPEMTTEPAMAPAAPAPGPDNTMCGTVEYDNAREDIDRMIPILTLTTLPEGMEELGELTWETREEDGAPFAVLTDEQAQRLLELLKEQGLDGLISMPANAAEGLWMLVLDAN